MSGNLGMRQLHELCKQVESTLPNTPLQKFDDLVRPLSDEMALVMASLKNNLVTESRHAQVHPLKKIKSMLADLKKLLKDQDPEAANVLRDLGIVKGYEKQMGHLQKAMKAYDFDSALRILTEIKIGSDQT